MCKQAAKPANEQQNTAWEHSPLLCLWLSFLSPQGPHPSPGQHPVPPDPVGWAWPAACQQSSTEQRQGQEPQESQQPAQPGQEQGASAWTAAAHPSWQHGAQGPRLQWALHRTFYLTFHLYYALVLEFNDVAIRCYKTGIPSFFFFWSFFVIEIYQIYKRKHNITDPQYHKLSRDKSLSP